MSTILITGGKRGLGLALVKRLATATTADRISKILVTSRDGTSEELQNVIDASKGRVVNVDCEPTVQKSVVEMAKTVETIVGEQGLDILVNNIGFAYSSPSLAAADPDKMQSSFEVNVVSTHRVTSALLPALKRGKEKKIMMISSSVGSLNTAHYYTALTAPVYQISKTAMNGLGVQYSLELKDDGFTVLMISPGWLRTNLGSDYADLHVDQGAEKTAEIILDADRSQNGKFVNIKMAGWKNAAGIEPYDGAEIPW